jgi:hypothetical protein
MKIKKQATSRHESTLVHPHRFLFLMSHADPASPR